ncbi:hypothetical protein Fmac_005151 [Flemingia macrophylla]|uniref:non-specific serine/threonine protein kinase n=1 Tax=Flemingia macrophylla TaxID=520843 RepID=A0ABD1N6Z2_9FABA
MAAPRFRKKSYVHASFRVTLTLLLLVTPRAASLAFNFSQFGDTGNLLNISGDVQPYKEVLNLTMSKRDSYGRVIYHEQLHLWDKNTGRITDFTTHFTFTINSPNKTLTGDGITFFLAKPNFPQPDPRDGSGIGLMSRDQMSRLNYAEDYPFVAVEFDTFGNDWDPKYYHMGIDVNSIKTYTTTEWFTGLDERPYVADISYDSGSNRLSVTCTGYKDTVTIKQNISAVVNLRDVLPDWVEFGFSSATGDFYFEENTLSSWSFNSSLDLESPKGGSKRGLVIGLSVGAGVLIVILGLVLLVRWMLRRRCLEDVPLFDHAMDNDFERIALPKKFSYEELARATNNFASENKVGEGGFGAVYRGFMRQLNTHVAIKKVSSGSRQGVKEYASEVKIISQLRHKNLVQLVGWCHQHNDLLLIYEFMENGSLDSYLFKGKGLLTWKVRYNIARGLASALLYLHEDREECVLHRDIKSSNVMMDSNFNAKLGDFGLARLMDHGIGSKTTGLAGTIGYLPPEAATRGKASRESDVYSFGVVALEIACGRKAIEPSLNEEQMYLVDWVWELHDMGALLTVSDPSLYGHFDENEMERLMIVGLWCTQINFLLRPTIRQAVQVLNFEAPLPTVTPRVPASAYNASSFSSIPSRIPAFEIHQPVSSTSGSSLFTGSSQSNITLDISPPAAYLHTY